MKKFSCFLLVLCCLVSCFSLSAFAAEPSSSIDLQTEIYNAENGISDVPITPEMLGNATAFLKDKDGNIIENLDVSMTIRKMPATRASNGVNTYTATYVARANKADSDTNTKDDVVATATVTWNDILGTKNTLVSVSGGWTLIGDNTISDRKVAFGSKLLNGETYTETKKPYSNSFYYSPSDITGYTLFTRTQATISTGNTITLYVESKITT